MHAENRRRRIFRWLAVSALGSTLLLSGLLLSREVARAPIREGAEGFEGEPARLDREAPRLEEVQAAAAAVRRAVAEGEWAEAAERSRRLQTAWLGFRRRMQSLAGEPFWQTGDVSAFEQRLARLQDAAGRRDRSAAAQALDQMEELLHKYAGQGEGPANYPRSREL